MARSRDKLSNDELTDLINNQLDLFESGSIYRKSAVSFFSEIVDHIQTGNEVYDIDETVFLRLQKLRDSVLELRRKIEEETQSNVSFGLFFNIMSIVIISVGVYIVFHDFYNMEIPWWADVLFCGQLLFSVLLLLMLYYVYSLEDVESSMKEIERSSMNRRAFSECVIDLMEASSEHKSLRRESKIQENTAIRKGSVSMLLFFLYLSFRIGRYKRRSLLSPCHLKHFEHESDVFFCILLFFQFWFIFFSIIIFIFEKSPDEDLPSFVTTE